MPDRRELTDPTTAPRLVSDVLRQSGQSENGTPVGWSSTTKPGSLRREHIARLWQRMAAIYGHKWVSSYGPDDSDDTWLRGLGGITPHEVAAGLSACVERADPWPPTLPQFRALCRAPKERRENAGMYREFPKALPAPPPSGERLAAAKAAVAEAKARLKTARGNA